MSHSARNSESSIANEKDVPAVKNLLTGNFPQTPEEALKRRNELAYDSKYSPLTYKNKAKDEFDKAGDKLQALPAVLPEFVKAEKLADQIANDPALRSSFIREMQNEQKYLPGETDPQGAWHTYDQTLRDLIDSPAVVRVSCALRLLEAAKADSNQPEKQAIEKQVAALLAEASKYDPHFLNDEKLQRTVQKMGLQDDLRQIQAESQGQVVAAPAEMPVARRQDAVAGGRAAAASGPNIKISEANKGWVALDIAQKALKHYMDACKQGVSPQEALAQTERAFQQAIAFAGSGDGNTQAMRRLSVQDDLNRGIDPISGQSCSQKELAERGKKALICTDSANKVVRALHAIALNNAGRNAEAIKELQPYAASGGNDLASKVMSAASQGKLYSGEFAQKDVERITTKLSEPVGASISPTPAPEVATNRQSAMPAAAPERRVLTVPPVAYGKSGEGQGAPVASASPEGPKGAGENKDAGAAPDRLQAAVNDFQQSKNLNHEEFVGIIKEREAAVSAQVKDIENKRDVLKGTIVAYEKARIAEENSLGENQKQLQNVDDSLSKLSVLVDKQKSLQDVVNKKTNLDKDNLTEANKLAVDKGDWGKEAGNFFNHDIDKREATLSKNKYESKNCQQQIVKLQNEIGQLQKQQSELQKSKQTLQATIAKQTTDLAGIVQDVTDKRKQVKEYWNQLDGLNAPLAEASAKYAAARVDTGMTEGSDGQVTQELLRRAALCNPQLLKDENFKQKMQAAHLDSVAEAKAIADARRSFATSYDQVYYAFDTCRSEGFTKDGMDLLKQVKDAAGTPSAESFMQLQTNLANTIGHKELLAQKKAIEKEMWAPVLARLAVAAGATQAKESKTFNDMVKEINALPKSADMEAVINTAIDFAKRGELMSQKQIADVLQAEPKAQTNQERGVLAADGNSRLVIQAASQDGKAETFLEKAGQVAGDIGSGWTGWAVRGAIAPYAVLAADAAAVAITGEAIATAPAWIPVVLAIGAGVTITLASKWLWNQATNARDKNVGIADAFNFGTFGVESGIKFLGKTAIGEAVKDTARTVVMPAIVKTTTEASLFVGKLAGKYGWLGKAAQESVKAEEAAQVALKEQAKKTGINAAEEKLAEHAQDPNVSKIAKDYGDKEYKRVLQEGKEAVVARKVALARRKMAEAIGEGFGKPIAKPVLSVKGLVMNSAKMTPASATYAAGRYVRDVYQDHVPEQQARTDFFINTGTGILGGGTLGAGGELLSKVPGAGKISSVVKPVAGAIADAVNKTPVIGPTVRAFSHGFAEYPSSYGSVSAMASESFPRSGFAAPPMTPITRLVDPTEGKKTDSFFMRSSLPAAATDNSGNSAQTNTPVRDGSTGSPAAVGDLSTGNSLATSPDQGATGQSGAGPVENGANEIQPGPQANNTANPEQTQGLTPVNPEQSTQAPAPTASQSQPPVDLSDY